MKGLKMPRQAAAHRFSQVPRAEIQRSQFDRSHGVKTTFDAGGLVPFYVDEALPGDTFHLKLNAFVRMTTPLKPLMDNLYFETFFFFVPLRLIWTNFQKFMGEQEDPGDSTSFLLPKTTVPAAGYAVGKLQDYFGLPVGVAPGSPAWTHTCMPTRAYYRIWNEWFRDENLQQSVNQVGVAGFSPNYGDGPDVANTGGDPVMKRGKRHDYFTSCLPWPQKGTAVSLPLGTSAPVVSGAGGGIPRFQSGGAGTAADAVLQAKTAVATPDIRASAGSGAFAVNETLKWDDPDLVADLSGATAATINALRQAFQIQKLLERDARGGSRYTEIVRSHFGVTSPDARLQRSEYLGGGSVPVMVNPVAQNSATSGQPTPGGNLFGVGTATSLGNGFVKSFTEHGIILGLCNVRADLTYYQGVERFWSRSTRYDFYWPALAHIGEQSVLNQEIYVQGNSSDANTFGYQERYAEYRYKPSRVTGKMRPGVSGTLEIWHLAQTFGALPTLNATFIEETPPVARVVAVPSEPQFLMDAWIKLTCARPMPMYGVPGLTDHF